MASSTARTGSEAAGASDTSDWAASAIADLRARRARDRESGWGAGVDGVDGHADDSGDDDDGDGYAAGAGHDARGGGGDSGGDGATEAWQRRSYWSSGAFESIPSDPEDEDAGHAAGAAAAVTPAAIDAGAARVGVGALPSLEEGPSAAELASRSVDSAREVLRAAAQRVEARASGDGAAGAANVSPPASTDGTPLAPEVVHPLTSSEAPQLPDASGAAATSEPPTATGDTDAAPVDSVVTAEAEMATLLGQVFSDIAGGTLALPDFHTREYWEGRYAQEQRSASAAHRSDGGGDDVTADTDATLDWYPESVDGLVALVKRAFADVSSASIGEGGSRGNVVVLGCGSSLLSQRLYDAVLAPVVNLDFSETVILQMRAAAPRDVPLTWVVADVCSGDWPVPATGSVAVVDKGTADAIVCDRKAADGNMAVVRAQAHRALVRGGVWCVASHSAPAERLPYLCPCVAAEVLHRGAQRTAAAAGVAGGDGDRDDIAGTDPLAEALAAAKKRATRRAVEAAIAAALGGSSATADAVTEADSGSSDGLASLELVLDLSGGACAADGWSRCCVYATGSSLGTWVYVLVK